jgi:hypothetical protein
MKLKFLSLLCALTFIAFGTAVKAEEQKAQEITQVAEKQEKEGAQLGLPSPAAVLQALCSVLPTITSKLPVVPPSCAAAFNSACNSVTWAALNCCLQDLNSSGLISSITSNSLVHATCFGGCNGTVCALSLCKPADANGNLPLSSNLCGYLCTAIGQSITNCQNNCMKSSVVFQQTAQQCAAYGAPGAAERAPGHKSSF